MHAGVMVSLDWEDLNKLTRFGRFKTCGVHSNPRTCLLAMFGHGGPNLLAYGGSGASVIACTMSASAVPLHVLQLIFISTQHGDHLCQSMTWVGRI
jgi:hypothetical protein